MSDSDWVDVPEDNNWVDVSSSGDNAKKDALGLAFANANGFQKASSGVLSGVAGLGDLADLGLKYLAGSTSPGGVDLPFKIGDILRSGSDWATGVPNSTKIGEGDFYHTAGSFLPGMLTGEATTGANLLKGAGMAALRTGLTAGADVAAAPFGTAPRLIADVLAGNLPEIASKVPGFFSKFGTAAKLAQAQEGARGVLDSLVSDKAAATQSLDNALSPASVNALSNPFGSYKRTAEVTQDVGLAGLESALQKDPMLAAKSEMVAQDAAREAARQGLHGSITPMNETPEVLGDIVREGLSKGEAGQKSIVDFYGNAMRAVPSSVDAVPAKMAVRQAINNFTKSGARTINGDFRKLVTRFSESPSTMKLQDLRDFSSEFGEYTQVNKLTDNAVSRSTAKAAVLARKAIDSQIEKAVIARKVSPDTARDLAGMIRERKILGSTFQSGPVGKALRKKFGDYLLDSSKVGGSLIKTPRDARQALEALRGESASVDALRSSLLDHIHDASFNSMTGEFNHGTYVKQLSKLSNVSKEILAPHQVEALGLIASDMKSQATVKQLAYSASKNASITSESERAIQSIKEAVLSKTSEKLKKIPYVGGVADKIYSFVKDPEARAALIKQELTKVALDPKYARAMLQPAVKANVALPKISRSLTQALGDFAAIKGSQSTPTTNMDTSLFHPITKPEPIAPLSFKFPDRKPAAPKVLMAQSVEVPLHPKTDETIATPDLVKKVIKQESGGNAKAISPKGAQGTMQLMPRTGKELASQIGETYRPYDPKQNVKLGTLYLNQQLKKYKRADYALAAYNMGPYAFDEAMKGNRSIPIETRKYVRNILGLELKV